MNTPIPAGSVVVGVDGSPGGDLALDWAVGIARARHLPLAVAHGTGTPRVTDFAIDMDEANRSLTVGGRQIVDRAVRTAEAGRHDLQVISRVAVEDPRQMLLDLGEDAAMVVVGVRGHGPLTGLLLGSVSTAVAGRTRCPVVVARTSPEMSGHDDRPVVLGVDGVSSTSAVDLAFELASWENRPLLAVRALGHDLDSQYYHLISLDQIAGVRREFEVRVAEALAGHAEKYPDVHVRTSLVVDSPAHALRDASKGAFAVVVGTRGRNVVASRLLGSVSRSVVERAESTVIVAPHAV